MSQALIRHLRLFCASPNVPPVRQQDGVLAVAGVLERAGLARLLLVDMERWGRNPGASVTNAVDHGCETEHEKAKSMTPDELIDELRVTLSRLVR